MVRAELVGPVNFVVIHLHLDKRLSSNSDSIPRVLLSDLWLRLGPCCYRVHYRWVLARHRHTNYHVDLWCTSILGQPLPWL